ncbi:tail fiber assembly protein [Enterobacter roggenkampii]|nr:tail fiber assembly protein [Enterobacter roggenkampii]
MWKEEFDASESWPDDAVEVTDEIFAEFSSDPPFGKMLGAGKDGLPAWIDIPAPSREELIAEAEQHKSALFLEAQATISLWQTELQLGIISDEDKASLIAWMNYIKAVQAVDTSKAPDITWPDKPE